MVETNARSVGARVVTLLRLVVPTAAPGSEITGRVAVPVQPIAGDVNVAARGAVVFVLDLCVVVDRVTDQRIHIVRNDSHLLRTIDAMLLDRRVEAWEVRVCPVIGE